MTRIPKRLALAGLLTLFACSDAINPIVTLLDLSFTLQGKVMDAVNGAPLGGDLKLYLVQGPTVRGPSRLITGDGDPLQGEYAFTGVPLNFNEDNNIFKVIAIRGGYQRFEAEIEFHATSQDQTDDGSHFVLDKNYTRIGNIYLWPIGAQAPDYTVSVTYNGKPVPSATVMLDPVATGNSKVFGETGGSSTLAATNGYVQSLIGTTDATTGKVTFAGGNLALGGQYKPQVLPVMFTEPGTSTKIPIGQSTSSPAFNVGLDNTDIRISMADLSNSGNPNPLYITSRSNSVVGALQPNGSLVITFNIPVVLTNTDGYDAVFNPGTKADNSGPGAGKINCFAGPAYCAVTTANTAKPVTASLSPDGLTLTLTPNYAPAPVATDRGVAIVYAEGPPASSPAAAATFPAIEAKDYPGQPFSLFGTGTVNGVTSVRLKDAAGATFDGTVQITAP